MTISRYAIIPLAALASLLSISICAAETRTVMVDTNMVVVYPVATNGGFSQITLNGVTITEWSSPTSGITQAYADTRYATITNAAATYLSKATASTQYLSTAVASTQYLTSAASDAKYFIRHDSTAITNVSRIITSSGILEFGE